MSKVYSYSAYGLTFHSALPLPELQNSEAQSVDVTIKMGHLDYTALNDSNTDFCCSVSREEAYFSWEAVGTFAVRSGREIIVDPLPGIEDRIIRLPLLGAVMAVLLHQRGYLVLHASAISLGNRAVAFVGDKGQGKSTMAAMLHRQGHQLLADDIVAITFDQKGQPVVHPGFPQVKLWSDAIVALGDKPDALPQIHPLVDKYSHQITGGFSKTIEPLRRIYVLQTGPAPRIKVLNLTEAIPHLIANSYMARFGQQLLQGQEAANHLHQCMDLVRHLPICQLERPRSLDLLADVAQLVETDLDHELQLA
ncbi:MAG TPA: hypothetical protein V6C65_18075, partial [Allocoleopsis sp.]